jgi:class 3 adenylate cyclase
LHGGKRIGDELIAGFPGFEFDDQVAIDAVCAGIQRAIVNDAQNRIEQMAWFDKIDFFAQRVQAIDLMARKQAIYRSVEQLIDRLA